LIPIPRFSAIYLEFELELELESKENR